jgi:hypothetical protein
MKVRAAKAVFPNKKPIIDKTSKHIVICFVIGPPMMLVLSWKSSIFSRDKKIAVTQNLYVYIQNPKGK